MKYLFFLLTFFAVATAHGQCSEFDRLLREGDSYLKKTNYQEAINSYTAAIIACSGRAGEAKQRITRMVNDINKLRENAQTALANLEKANASVVALLLENADRDILNLRYEDALQKIKTAAGLGVLKPDVARAQMEVAFFYTESGRFSEAQGIIATIARLFGMDAKVVRIDTSDVPATRRAFRQVLQSLDPIQDSFLQVRYFPSMIEIPGGTDTLGGEFIDNPRHVVTLSPFRMAKTEITWWQYNLYCEDNGTAKPEKSAGWGGEGDNPVIVVAWADAVNYANWLSSRDGKDSAVKITGSKYGLRESFGNYVIGCGYELRKISGTYRLPTEAEWEFAARGGKGSKYSGAFDDGQLEQFAWFNENSGGRTQPVASKKPNSYGLYDMSGNVWEWCWDWYGPFPEKLEKDYTGPPDGTERVIRGGAWNYDERRCGTAHRYSDDPAPFNPYYGFRLVFVP